MPRSRAPRAFCCAQGLARGKECAPSPSFLLPGKLCMGIVCQIANVTCRGEGQEAASGANFRHAGVRAREDPWAALKQERARPRRRKETSPSCWPEHRLLGKCLPCWDTIPSSISQALRLPRSPREGHFSCNRSWWPRARFSSKGVDNFVLPGVGMGPRHCSGDRPPCSGPRRPRNRLAPVAHAAAQKPANTAKAATRSSTIDAPDPSRNFT